MHTRSEQWVASGRSSTAPATDARPVSVKPPDSLLIAHRRQAILGFLIGLSVLMAIGVFALAMTRRPTDAPPDQLAEQEVAPLQAPDPEMALPLSAESLGFVDANIEEATLGDGPDGISFCNQRPTSDGLQRWRGNRITEPATQVRVVQNLGVFASATEAANYVASTQAIAGCGAWQVHTNDSVLQFVATPVTPDAQTTAHTDGSVAVFDIRVATESEATLFMRASYLQHGTTVLQLSVLSPLPSDLERMDLLLATAVPALQP